VYPDDLPKDTSLATGEVYVEIGEENSTSQNFQGTYSVTICTSRFILQELERHSYFHRTRPIVVDQFEDKLVKTVLELILSSI
jgi:hypothetical protein